jgi:hypothetical protein
MSPRSKGIFLHVFLLGSLAGLSSSCSVLQAPVSPPALHREQQYRISSAGLIIEAAPIRSWEEYWELFDDNLPEIGLLAVWVEVRNSRAQEVDLSTVKWRLMRGPENLSATGINELFSWYYKSRKLRFYSVNADKQSRQAFSKWMLPSSHLQPAQSQKGFLFFRSSSSLGADWNHNAVLVVRGLPAETETHDAYRNLELPLFNANP